MEEIFILLEWFNENHTAEELIAYIFVVFTVAGIAGTQILTVTQGTFIFFIGVVLCINFYAVALIQRWYIRKTQEKMKDFDYSKIVDEDFQTED